MFPFIETFFGIKIYTFGLTLTICFFLFLWMLRKLSIRFGADFSFFTKNIVWYFLSVFIFSRIFYVIGRWNDLKYIADPFDFFIMSDYNFSLAGAIFGFLLVLFIHIRLKNVVLDNYIDPLVLSFLFIACIGFVGAFLGGQIYGGQTTLMGLGLTYTNSFSNVPYQVPIFPLPVVYAIITFILFSALYTLSMYVGLRGLLGYIGMILFSCMILIFDFFSGKYDIFKDSLGVTMMQVFSLVIIGISAYYLYGLYVHQKSSYKTIIGKEFKS